MPTKVIILEGPRGAGKSSVAQALRHSIEGSTLINLTGFKMRGPEGYNKISYYYRAWMELLSNMNGDYTLIFDRTFFSEMVYSTLYKDYDFKSRYFELCEELMTTIGEIGDLYLFYLTVDDDEVLGQRLIRDKVKLFDQVPEDVVESQRQRREYDYIMKNFMLTYWDRKELHFTRLDTSHQTVESIRNSIMRTIQ